MRKLIGSLIVTVLLVIPVAVSAECAWVLWRIPTGKFYQRDRRGELPYGEVPSEVCQWPPMIDRAFPSYKDCMGQPEHRPPGDDNVRVVPVRSPRDEFFVGVTYTCLPDTIDPRGPKGGG